MFILSWLAIALVLLEFALADEPVSSPVGRALVGAGVVLLSATVLAVLLLPSRTEPFDLLVAGGPLAFIAFRVVLYRLFERLTGTAPRLAFMPVGMRPTAWDHLYSLLVGVVMLLSVMPAVARFVEP